ncbi:COG2426 family protein [Youxingia wuxianensis]|uniref:Small multi-drug export protein n=1 Tax=Youxingia wuxianensis TaxID=2763678 RepID=A0A926EJP1_9FIRM|nr:small multi-drug export protein [Youxingia wuxianensis]MBC8584613.1 small multi-drug export protein [Youxingia wuxianensis]
MNQLIDRLFEFLSVAGKEVALFIVSMVPLIELRGSIPLGAALGMPWYTVLVISLIGNLIPVPFIIWFGRPLFKWLKQTKLLSGITHKVETRLMKKADKVTKYELIGLCLFVAVPLPGTGAWSGAAIAALLGMRMLPSFISIALGVVIAGVIMTLGSYGVLGAISLL